jgi:16S rRNA (guanine966-N2)-methyltransferase
MVVIDAFCGSGILGFEALSRGAEIVTFIDSDREVCSNVRATATELSVGSKCIIVCTDAIPFLRTSTSPVADVIFSDAPYSMAVGTTLLSILEKGRLVRAGSLVVLDHSPNEYVVVSDSWRHEYHAHRGGSAIDVYVCQRMQNLHGEASS